MAAVHRWLGLALLVPLLAVATSGAALVWRAEFSRIRAPTVGTAMLPLDRYLAAARGRFGGAAVANLVLPERPGDTVTVTAEDWRRLRLDPATGRIVGEVAPDDGGGLRWVGRVHGALLLPGVGGYVVGAIGLLLVALALTGLWRWRPARRKRSHAIRWHATMGFWLALPLALMGLTGAWIAFPAAFATLVGEAPRLAASRLPPPARPLAAPALSLGEVLRAARSVAPPGRLRTIVWPTTRHADWTLAYDGWPMRSVTVADDGGVAARVIDRGPQVTRWVRRLHDGTAMGLVWRWFLTLVGIAPLLLGVTGVMWWWRRRPV